MQLLKVSSWLIKLVKGWFFFLFVWTIYFALRKRSFHIRLKASYALAFIAYRLWKGGRRRIRKNISLIRPDLTEKEVAQASWQAVKTIARSWAAMLGNEFTGLGEIKKRVKTEGLEQLVDYYLARKKVIATAVHIGPIDEMLGIIPFFGLRVYVPAEPVKPKWFFNLMMRLRLRFEGIILEPVKKGETLIQAAHHLSEGRIVLFVLDLPREGGSGVICRIGNAKARFPVGAIKLALEQDATIFPVFPSLEKGEKAKIVIGPPFEIVRTGDKSYDIEMNTRRLIEGVYAPHIRENYHSWLRLLWENLEPVSFDLRKHQI